MIIPFIYGKIQNVPNHQPVSNHIQICVFPVYVPLSQSNDQMYRSVFTRRVVKPCRKKNNASALKSNQLY